MTGALEDLRVFISYAHDSYEIARNIAAHLRNHGAILLWDRDFAHGSGFHDQIKTQIAFAHVFLPLITRSSAKRGWVHQEIGYATALHVPTLPIAIEQPPAAMLEGLHAVWFDNAKDIGNLELSLPPEIFLRLVERFDNPSLATYVCAAESEDRTRLLYRYAAEVRRLGHSGLVRQTSHLSSFHIPTETPEHIAWEQRYDATDQRSFYHRRLLRCERLALEWHAREAGAKLIVCPDITLSLRGASAAKARLLELKRFLKDAGDNGINVEVARGAKIDHPENVTIIGDWFMAASVLGTPKAGYRQTIFTRHAQTVRERIALFEQQFKECALWPGTGSSRERAIAYLDRELGKFPQE